jgi:hypothetical protein
MAPVQQLCVGKLQRASRLDDTLSQLVRMSLLLRNMLKKLRLRAVSTKSGAHVSMALVSEDAANFRHQRFAQQPDHSVSALAWHLAALNPFVCYNWQ